MVVPALPPPVFASFEDYLAQTPWTTLRRACCDRAKRANRKRLLSPAPQERLPPLTVWQVLRDARGRCFYCGSLAVEGRPSDPRNGSPVPWEQVGRRLGSLDHAKTRFSGGDNERTNLAWCCLWCNTWPRERRRGATDHGGYYPDLDIEPLPEQCEAIVATKYTAATGRLWVAAEAFAVKPKPELEIDDGDDSQLFPDHECPEDTAMWRDIFG